MFVFFAALVLVMALAGAGEEVEGAEGPVKRSILEYHPISGNPKAYVMITVLSFRFFREFVIFNLYPFHNFTSGELLNLIE